MNMKFSLKLTIVWVVSFPPAAIKHFMDLEIVDYAWLQFYLPLNKM